MIAQNSQFVLLTAFLLGHNLTAGAAGAGGRKHTLRVAAHDGQRLDSNTRMLGRGRKKGSPLSAKSTRIGYVLLVAALDDGAVGQTQRGTDVEVGIGCVGGVGRLYGRFHQLAVGSIQFSKFIFLIMYGLRSFHIFCYLCIRFHNNAKQRKIL